MQAAVTRTSASAGCLMTESGTFSTRTSPAPYMRVARMVVLLLAGAFLGLSMPLEGDAGQVAQRVAVSVSSTALRRSSMTDDAPSRLVRLATPFGQRKLTRCLSPR